jgi:NAD dependent epimerase/dehydratase
MPKNKILVTGAEGFIGSHLVEFLLKKNYNVKAFVHYNSFNSIGWLSEIDKKYSRKIDFHFGDIRDFKNVQRAYENVSLVIHLAALIGIPYSYTSPLSYIETNITGTYNVLENSLQNKIKRTLITSTSEVYGNPKKIPIKETDQLNAQSPYAATKIAADKIAESYFRSFGLNITIVRPFNTYGPRQSNRAVIPSIINQILSGDEIKVGNLSPKRDLVYIEDTVRGYEKILQSKKLNGQIIHIATGKSISIKSLIHNINKILKSKAKVKIDEKRVRNKKSEILCLNGSCEKTFKFLKWKPTVSIAQGLIKTIDWYSKSYKNNINYDDYFI